MRDTDIQTLIALDNRFYRDHAASFSATRSAPWQGWNRVIETLHALNPPDDGTGLRVLDLACGNMRLARYLEEALPRTSITYYGIDACEQLARAAGDEPCGASIRFQRFDVLASARHLGSDALDPCGLPPVDLACCFGFMHHIPGSTLRADVARSMVHALCPHGLAAFSFWQFMDDDRLAAKARTITQQARAAGSVPELEDDDYLLGWQDDERALRYCHHFSEDAIDALVERLGRDAREICRFSADGRTGRLNRYLIVQRL